jgi:hypothetical protein
MDRRVHVVAVARADGHAVAVLVEPLVDGPVAVVVDEIADLHGAGVDRRVVVVAVVGGGVTVVVGVDADRRAEDPQIVGPVDAEAAAVL